ncbi:MAG: hypothetical protein M3270_04800 [Thermoproteota archaeon]|nr:hypothetical protein [Thermoproteota archaeon]
MNSLILCEIPQKAAEQSRRSGGANTSKRKTIGCTNHESEIKNALYYKCGHILGKK